MARFPIHQAQSVVLGVLTAIISLQACSSATDADDESPAPGFALKVGSAAVPVMAGATAITSITATRTGGLTGAIGYAVTGVPTGLAASIEGTSVSDSSTLTFIASPALAAATYPIVVTATAPASAAHQVTITVTVSAPTGGEAPAITLVVAGEHTCALTTTGSAYCWGFNGKGGLGNNETSIANLTPVPVVGGLTFQSLSVSHVFGISCGLTTGGAAYCWGDNVGGALGDGTTTRRLTPTPVAGGLSFRSLVVGTDHVCGLDGNGTAYCWGSSPNGAFGDGFVGTRLTPTVAAPGMTFQSIVAGSDYTCALTPAGAAYCWGLGFTGQLGVGASTTSTTPVAVSGGLTFRSLAAGGRTVCGLTIDGKAYCWGDTFYGTVGDGTSATVGGTTRVLAPVAVDGGLTFQSISAGYETMCAVTDTGAGYCWGYNFGAIGDGTSDHRSRPAAVAGGLTFQSISSGTGYGCGVTTANAVYCWGDDADGALGDGTGAPHATPAPVRWP